MCDIAFIKQESLISDQIIEVFKSHITKNIQLFEPEHSERLFEENINPNIILIDILKEHFSELYKVVAKLKETKKKVIVWLPHAICNSKLSKLFKLNLDGYFFTEMENEELIYAMQRIMRGEKYIHSTIGTVLLNDYRRLTDAQERRPNNLLTNRE